MGKLLGCSFQKKKELLGCCGHTPCQAVRQAIKRTIEYSPLDHLNRQLANLRSTPTPRGLAGPLLSHRSLSCKARWRNQRRDSTVTSCRRGTLRKLRKEQVVLATCKLLCVPNASSCGNKVKLFYTAPSYYYFGVPQYQLSKKFILPGMLKTGLYRIGFQS